MRIFPAKEGPMPEKADKPSIAIIGAGVVGTTLGVLAARAGYRVVGVAGRNPDKVRAAAAAIGPDVRADTPGHVAAMGELVFLTVPDDAIAGMCLALAETGGLCRGACVAHCSGALSSSVLEPARLICHAAVGSMHPLQTFPNVQAGLERFGGTYCFCEGDEPAVRALMALARDIGAKPVRMHAQGKLLYHASAVLACNYLTALLDAALATAEKAGIPRADAAAALEPLVRSTLLNIKSMGPAKALTGPIARGDVQLVARQYHDVAMADSLLGEIYRALGHWAIGLALRKGSIDELKAHQLTEALTKR